MTELRLYVIDTGCLLELYKVDALFSDAVSVLVKSKFSEAVERQDRFYIPMPVLYEFANHVAQIKNTKNRKKITDKFVESVKTSISDSSPWIITHPSGSDSIENLMTALKDAVVRFNENIEQQSFSLVDIVVVKEAERLKEAHPSSTLKKFHVHIWSTEQAVKALEPDTEPNAFI